MMKGPRAQGLVRSLLLMSPLKATRIVIERGYYVPEEGSWHPLV